MTRVALIAGTYLPEVSSVADYTTHLYTALDKYDVQSEVLTTYYAALAAYDPIAIGVVHGWRFADLWVLVQAVHDSGAEVLHIQYTARSYNFKSAILLLPLLLKLTGWRSPIVTTVHDYGTWGQPQKIPSPLVTWLKTWGQNFSLWDREDGFLLTLSDAVITTNSETEAAIHQQLPKLKNIVCHIPIAANVEVAPIERALARQLLRKNCNWPDDAIVVAYFGFVHPGKGLETLLSAFKQVVTTQPQARLLLIGGFDSLVCSGEAAKKYLVELQTMVSELGLQQLVHFTGYVSAKTVSHYLAGADIGVLPRDRANLNSSSSLLTLLAHSLPVVATQPQSLPADYPVRLVPPHDVTALATELIQLINNSVECKQLSAASRVFAQNYTWSNIAEAHLEVYRQAKTFSVQSYQQQIN